MVFALQCGASGSLGWSPRGEEDAWVLSPLATCVVLAERAGVALLSLHRSTYILCLNLSQQRPLKHARLPVLCTHTCKKVSCVGPRWTTGTSPHRTRRPTFQESPRKYPPAAEGAKIKFRPVFQFLRILGCPTVHNLLALFLLKFLWKIISPSLVPFL